MEAQAEESIANFAIFLTFSFFLLRQEKRMKTQLILLILGAIFFLVTLIGSAVFTDMMMLQKLCAEGNPLTAYLMSHLGVVTAEFVVCPLYFGAYSLLTFGLYVLQTRWLPKPEHEPVKEFVRDFVIIAPFITALLLCYWQYSDFTHDLTFYRRVT